jgi:Mg/Co/Ni transporter MgtE
MPRPVSVTLAYIDTRPASAAADLSRLDPEDAGAFVDSIPVRYAVKVMGLVSSWSGASILARMSASKAVGILIETPFAKAVEILRLMETGARTRVLEDAPRRLKRDFEISLSYPEDTVGASMVIETFAFPPEQLVRDVLTEIRSTNAIQSDVVFVVSPEHELLGAVQLLALLRAEGGQKLENIMREDIQCLSARSRLLSVANLEGWDTLTLLPVLSRRNHLVGALSKKVVTEKLDMGNRGIPVASASISAAVASAFIYSGVECVKLLADSQTRVRG